jgi:hypothetical protein
MNIETFMQAESRALIPAKT